MKKALEMTLVSAVLSATMVSCVSLGRALGGGAGAPGGCSAGCDGSWPPSLLAPGFSAFSGEAGSPAGSSIRGGLGTGAVPGSPGRKNY